MQHPHNAELTPTLVEHIASHLADRLRQRAAGHCVRVDDLSAADAHAVAEAVEGHQTGCAVHVLTRAGSQYRLEIGADRAIELRNRKRQPLLLLIPSGVGHAASSLDNSFEPLPLLTLLTAVTTSLEKELAAAAVAPLITEVKQVLGRSRQVEPWARFLGAVAADPNPGTVGRHLWQVGLLPDLGDSGIEARLKRNSETITAIARPARSTARVIDRLVEAGVKAGPFRQKLLAFLERQEAGLLADPAAWAREIQEHHPGELTFERWPLVELLQAGLTQIKVTPFRRENGTVDPQCKLRLADDGQMYCDVAPDQPGKVAVKWTTEPARTTSVASWRVEMLPPPDLREVDTLPIATTKVKGDKRRATLNVDVSDDDLVKGTLFVIRVRAQDPDGNDLQLQEEGSATAESDQFQVGLHDHVPDPSPRAADAASLPEAVLRTAVDTGGDLTESAPMWDSAGQVFDLRIGTRRALIRVSRVIAGLQRWMTEHPHEAVAFDAHSPHGEPIDPDGAQRRPLNIPPALADRRRRLLSAIAAGPPRDVVEVMNWDDELRGQAQGYVQSYRRALDGADPQSRTALLAMDTLVVRVGTANDEVLGLVLLPTHPLRLAWAAAHDRLLRDWAGEAAIAGKTRAVRAGLVDLATASRLSPANMPFTMLDRDGRPLVYAEELTHGSALYLHPDATEPQAASDAICAAIDVARDNVDMSVSARALGGRIRGYRDAHPGTGPLRFMAVNPGSGAVLRQALRPFVLPDESDDPGGSAPAEAARLDIIAYSDRLSYTDPVADLRELQRTVASGDSRRAATHVVASMGLAARALDRLTSDREGHHLAVVQDMTRCHVTVPAAKVGPRTTVFQDLLTPLSSERAPDGSPRWYVMPALKPRGSGRPEADIVEAHRAHQAAIGAHLKLPATPALAIELLASDLLKLRAIHEQADWVITLDQGIGPEIFEETASAEPGSARYLLDYTPDFLEGFGKKLTVTTAHYGEVLRILGDAMHDLGLSKDEPSVSRVLNRLLLVSGRLAMRLLRDTSLSVEAVSLAAVMAHLERRGQLANRIVVPVDAHPEIFGARARNENEPARRCDLLLVRVTQRSLRIECLEVKGRRTAQLPAALADDIVDQLDHTERVLQGQFFATDPPRLDDTLQRSRLAGLLHYYATRSARHGLIDADRLEELHRNIDRIEETAEPAEISKTGYVISPDGDAGFPAKHRGVSIKVLTAADLGEAGFTTTGRTVTPPSPEPHTETSEHPAPSPADGTAAPQGEPAYREPAETTQRPETSPSNVSVELGVDGAGAPITWDLSTKGSPHAFILGIPGQGKSVTTRRIIREFAAQRLPSLILDFHGDMAADPPPGAQVIDAAEGLPFSPFELPSEDPRAINVTAWEVAEIIGYVCGLGDIQRSHVYDGLRHAYAAVSSPDTVKVPTMAQFADAVEETEQGARGRNARDRIRPLTDFGLFAADPAEKLETAWTSGAVVDLSRLSLETVQLAAGAFLLRRIYRQMFRWGQSDVLRLAVVLDEAHRLARDVTLPKLMKEGRKYGTSVVVASQGIADFHRDVVGNAGTKVIFRTNYPDSKITAGFLRGRAEQDLSKQIEELAVGCAYVSSPEHVRARKVYMHI